MALVAYDRVRERTATVGTGAYALAGAVTGYRAFSTVGDANTCHYCATDGSAWEIGLGTYTLSGTTLARTTLIASSTGSAISWVAGTKDIFLTEPASILPMLTSPNTWTGVQSFNNMVVIPKTTGYGIKVDTASPTYPWVDLIGMIKIDEAGPNAASLSTFMGGSIRRFAFSATDKADLEFHLPHDYAPGTDLFLHYHWSHNGTAISGNIVATFVHTYAKGHNQAAFSAEKTLTHTYNTVDLATTPRYQHRIEEVQLSTAGGGVTTLDSSTLEVDGIIGVNFTMTTIPTITGGTSNEPFVLFIDIHYQSTGMGTKQKSPPFWT